MRVEILKPVAFRGEVKASGTVDAPDSTAHHWIATGAAKPAEVKPAEVKPDANPPAQPPAAAADSGKKSRF